MRSWLAALGTIGLLLTPGLGADTDCRLEVAVEGVESATGIVGLLVFDSPAGWPEDFDGALRRQAAVAEPGVVTVAFDGLPPGRYGVVALHDRNENRKMDRNFFGLPKEGWGMSNNPAPRFSAPSFEKAAFEHGCADRIEIRLRY